MAGKQEGSVMQTRRQAPGSNWDREQREAGRAMLFLLAEAQEGGLKAKPGQVTVFR